MKDRGGRGSKLTIYHQVVASYPGTTHTEIVGEVKASVEECLPTPGFSSAYGVVWKLNMQRDAAMSSTWTKTRTTGQEALKRFIKDRVVPEWRAKFLDAFYDVLERLKKQVPEIFE